MNIDIKRAAAGIGILFLIFCFAFILNRVLDRSADDDIIIKTETEETSIEEESTNVNTEETDSDSPREYLKNEKENGDVYEGYMKNGKYDGKGVLKRKKGEIYDGIWDNGAFDSGKITFRTDNFGGEKTVTIAEGKDMPKDGKFAAILENGDIYDGQWYNGLKDGEGILYSRGKNDAPTKISEGMWEEDVLVSGKETYLYSDNIKTYIVEIKDGFRDGTGALYDENESIIETEMWRDDIPVE